MKQSALPTKYLKYLGWLAPIFIAMGTTIRLFSNDWNTLSLTLIFTGVLVLSLWSVSESNALPTFLRQRSTQTGTNIIISTVSMVIILGLINFLAVQSLQRIDLTENQLFSLAPQTKDVLSSLKQPITLFFFRTDTNRPSSSEIELLNQYRRQSDRFTYEIVDPQAKPSLAQEFGIQTRSGEIYLQLGSKKEFIQPVNPSQILTERPLTNGIVRLLSTRQTTVYFLQGHGEYALDPGPESLSDAVDLLRSENYQVKPLNLAQSTQPLNQNETPENNIQTPRDADVIVIAGAKRSLFEAEVKALQTYLNAKSGLLVLLDPQVNLDLEDLLDDWSIEPINRLIIDPSGPSLGADITTTLVQTYGDHPITSTFGNNYSFYPGAQPINLDIDALNEDSSTIESSPLLISSELTQAFPIPENGDIEITENNAMQGPLVFGVALNRPVDSLGSPLANTNETDSNSKEDEQSNQPPTLNTQQEETDKKYDSANVSDKLATEDNKTSEDKTAKTSDQAKSKSDVEPEESRLVVIGNSSFIRNNLVTQQLNADVFLNTVGWLSQRTDEAIAIRPKEPQNRRIVLKTSSLITIALTAIAILPLLGFGGALALWLKRR